MFCFLLTSIFALSPPTGVEAHDTPNDGGNSITVEWTLSADDAQIEFVRGVDRHAVLPGKGWGVGSQNGGEALFEGL